MVWTLAKIPGGTKSAATLLIPVAFIAFGFVGDDTSGLYDHDLQGAARTAQLSAASIQIENRADSFAIDKASRQTLLRRANQRHANRPRFIAATLMGSDSTSRPLPSDVPSPTNEFKNRFQKRQFDEALDEANKLIRNNPNNSDAYNLQGGAYLAKKDLANARKSFEKALSLQPENIQALLNLAQLDLLRKDVPSARKRYQAILAKDPQNVAAMFGMAQVEGNTNNEKEVLAWLQKAKSANPQSLAPRLRLGAYYLRTQNFAKALTELTDAQQYHPDVPELLDLLGQAQIANGQKSAAVLTYGKLVSVRPDSAAAHFRLANARINDGDLPGGTESLKKALQLKPDYVEAAYELAALNVMANRVDEALKLGRQLQTLTPQSPAGFVIEGDVLSTQKRYVDAVNAFEKALALQKTGPIDIKLHAAQTQGGNAKEADARLEQWLKEHPDDVLVRRYVAAENVTAGRNKLAIEQYELTLKKFPNDLSALNNLANLYQKENDPRALKLAEVAYKLRPDSPNISDTLGWILVEQGKTKRGLELVQQAAAKLPKNTEVRYHLAVALTKSGDKTKARKELEALLASDERFPQREAAQSLLKQL